MQYQEKQLKIIKEALINEKNIIGSLAFSKDKALYLIPQIKEKWFLNDHIKNLFVILKKAQLEGSDHHLEISKSKLSQTYADCLETQNVRSENLISTQKEHWLKYNLNKVIQNFVEIDGEPIKLISSLWSELTKLTDGQEIERSDMDFIFELFEKERKEYIQKQEDGKSLIGYSTGFKCIDESIDGLRDGHLIIVGGYTSAGKTQFVLNIVKKLIEQEVKVSFYSLEMSKVDIFKRMLGILSGVNGSYLMKNKNSEDIKNKYVEVLKQSGMKVHTEKYDLDEILMNMIIEKQTQGVKAFFIDYAQLVKAGGSGIYEDMRSLAIKLQNFCRTYEVPVVLVSQVSNENAKIDSDMIGFKGAGDLGASADMAIELKSAEDKGERERRISENKPVRVKIHAKKNRHGKIFNDEIFFQPLSGQFTEDSKEYFGDF
jgi:replicative DNA helicase